MARLSLAAFDHVPAGLTATAAAGSVAQYASYPFVYTPSSQSTATSSGGITVDSGGTWLNIVSANAGSQVAYGSFTAAISAFSDWVANQRTYVGFRTKFTGSQVRTPINAFSVNDGVSVTIALVLWSDFAWVAGKEYFVEVLIDRLANTRTVWVDGNVVVNGGAIATSINSMTKFVWFQGGGVVSGSSCSLFYKDIYVMDDPMDGSIKGPLGPVKMVPLVETNGVAGNWTGSISGTVDAILNTGGVNGPVSATSGAGTASTPVMQSPTDGSPLKLGFVGSGLDASLAIRAVQVLHSSARFVGTSSKLSATFTDPAAHSVALPDTVYASDAYVANKVLVNSTKAPDGGDWSVSKINQLTLNLVAASVGS